MLQISHLYMTTGKTIALTRWTLVGKVMSLLFNMLSRLIKKLIAFPPRSSHLLISWLLSPSAVIFEPPKIKSLTVPIVFPSICHEVPPVNNYNKKKRLTHPSKGWPFQEMFCKTEDLFALLPYRISLSTNFTSPMPLPLYSAFGL